MIGAVLEEGCSGRWELHRLLKTGTGGGLVLSRVTVESSSRELVMDRIGMRWWP